MNTVSVSQASSELGRLIAEAAASHEPTLITAPQSNAVLMAEEDWRAVQETLYLLSIPGMCESLQAGRDTPLAECVEEFDP